MTTIKDWVEDFLSSNKGEWYTAEEVMGEIRGSLSTMKKALRDLEKEGRAIVSTEKGKKAYRYFKLK